MVTKAERKEKGQSHRERNAARSREQVAAVADIGDIPKVKNPSRRKQCRLDLHRFLVTYFPNSTGLSPFSEDHHRVIARIQRCFLEGGRFVNAVYRGFAKTSISEGAAIWAVFYGHRKFVPVFGADATAAEGIIDSIKMELSDNDLLMDDFPEVCHAVRSLEGKPQRAMTQSYRGDLTHIEWTAQQIVLPTIPGSVASGAVLCSGGITGGFRGMKHKRPDGTQQRPDAIILDDPQTDESAATLIQVNKTLNKIRKALVKLGGHRKSIAIVVNATVIEPDDAIDKLLVDPAWQSERIPLVKQWPDAHKTLWLDTYATMRKTYRKDSEDDQKRAWERATAFYRDNRAAMDAGGVVSWESCYDADHEISALQHAYNALIDDGEEAFASEYQVRPLPRADLGVNELKPDLIAARVNQCPRGVAPSGTMTLTAAVDVQQDALYWMVCGWGEAFGGAVVDWGTWPDQRRPYFALRDVRPTLAQATGIATVEGSIYAGLDKLILQIVPRDWPIHGGGVLRVERCLVDSGDFTSAVKLFCRQSGQATTLLPSKGYGIGPTGRTVDEWSKRDGEKRGDNWVIRPPVVGQGRMILFDSNHWKTFIARRLTQPMGERGAFRLFGDATTDHRMLADHCCAEFRIEDVRQGRKVEVWKIKPSRPDNHLFDVLVLNAVAASVQGVTHEASEPAKAKKRVSWSEQRAKAMMGR